MKAPKKAPLCAGCYRRLTKQQTNFCPICALALFDGRTVSAGLRFPEPQQAEPEEALRYRELTRQMSMSGVQEKFSVRLTAETSALELTRTGGQFILKPIPDIKQHAEAVPANEHLTMQLARQVFRLPVAACAVVQFAGGQPAYLTRRFDVQADGSRLLQEDFAQLAGRTQQQHGLNYKYDFSCEEMGQLLRQLLPATYLPELTAFFRLLLFNYLVGNGDAHLKNFSLYRTTADGAYHLTPAYDLLSTKLHFPYESDTAVSLFADPDDDPPDFSALGFYTYPDFLALGQRLGLPLSRVRRLLTDIVSHEAKAQALIDRSFLPDDLKVRYAAVLADRRQRLRYGAPV
ncbi:HipA domain-containing protein [Hymenobacter rubripertinctus]|uniref:Type II toxin-antitoxin system HipA family toxin n=1 Tax=Hymenobacter rubripertinctus TaxID=2029981 RepID=A0A418R5S9_9BACT|nr:HipA domain-containing protein [Hymenobacter rubripertinctus]RIY12827.1 type II toxin-antitoxin system HipA family toxin [Hymenobacter rubripertinctus]